MLVYQGGPFGPQRYRVNHIALFFMIWLKMTLKSIVHKKQRYFYSHKDPPFDMKHQLISADPLPVVKIDRKLTSCFALFFLSFLPKDLIFFESMITKLVLSAIKYKILFVFSPFYSMRPTIWSKNWRIQIFQFFYSFIKILNYHQSPKVTPKTTKNGPYMS